MTTTALIVEILVVGTQAFTALLMALEFSGIKISSGLIKYNAHAGVIALLAVTISYTLGVIVDRVAVIALSGLRWFLARDSPCCFGQCWRSLKQWYRSRHANEVRRDEDFVKSLHREGRLSQIIENHQSRLRVARGTCFNVLLFGLLLAIVLIVKIKASWWIVLLIYFSLAMFSILVWSSHLLTFEERVRQARTIQG